MCAVCASRSVRDLLVVGSGLERDWYVSALPNQGHAGEDGGPKIDGCESKYEQCADAWEAERIRLLTRHRRASA